MKVESLGTYRYYSVNYRFIGLTMMFIKYDVEYRFGRKCGKIGIALKS